MSKSVSIGLIAAAIAGCILTLFIVRTCSNPQPESVANAFISYVSKIEGRQDLLLAKKTVQEKIRKEIRSGSPIAKLLSVLFGSDVGLAKVELSCVVEYNYYVSLDPAGWTFDLAGKNLKVTSPRVQLLKPPGFHSETVEARILDRSIFIQEKEHLSEMKKFLSDTLSVLGERYVRDVQDTCRARLREILKNFSKELKSEIEVETVKFEGE